MRRAEGHALGEYSSLLNIARQSVELGQSAEKQKPFPPLSVDLFRYPANGIRISCFFEFKDLRKALLFGLPTTKQVAQCAVNISSALENGLFVSGQHSACRYENAVLPAMEIGMRNAPRVKVKTGFLVL